MMGMTSSPQMPMPLLFQESSLLSWWRLLDRFTLFDALQLMKSQKKNIAYSLKCHKTTVRSHFLTKSKAITSKKMTAITRHEQKLKFTDTASCQGDFQSNRQFVWTILIAQWCNFACLILLSRLLYSWHFKRQWAPQSRKHRNKEFADFLLLTVLHFIPNIIIKFEWE